ncbi:MAG TPA: cobalamin-dependent protein [Acidobacteriota bacterium]|nr:radical SAM protein [Acidobacteriota bacterium]HOT00380.1 cobalamin-dependent protein [Acidobacteriota bacterium]HQF86707.1 cobalamin-dependent protein [Acidobacteriota bacterium]HQG90041.1 cobalamin-dependent protein [Acidobacteriota bacterium]HQK86382.1 cobalamin-dependent protein [Acidobacteriota bacterium]
MHLDAADLNLDAVLVHVPRMLVRDPVLGSHARINFPAAGLLALAGELERRARRCRIVHLGAEKLLDPRFLLADYVGASGASLAAFSLHWHPQTYDTLAAARQLKAVRPRVRVVLGGYTASHFAGEILTECPFVDAVVRGEGERPLAALADAVRSGQPDLSEIPNVSWRDPGGAVRHNPIGYCADAAELDAADFAALRFYRHPETVFRLQWIVPWEGPVRLLQRLGRDQRAAAVYGVPAGRGCPGSCTWCGGSGPGVRRLTGRTVTVRRGPEGVAESVARLRTDWGIARFYFCFDPDPACENHTAALVAALGRLRPAVRADFEFFGLPSPELCRLFRRVLHHTSTVILSPETADEALRQTHRAYPFTNGELEERLDLLNQLRAPTTLYFALGLPGETAAGVLATHDYIRRLRRRFASIRSVHVFPVEMEPGAPWFEAPERYGVRRRRRSLGDFIAASAAAAPSLGYDTATLTEAEILRLHRRLFAPGGRWLPPVAVTLRALLRLATAGAGGMPVRWLRRHAPPTGSG